MRTTRGWFSSPIDGTRLATYTWGDAIDGPPGIVQIVHSTTDHVGVYRYLAEGLAEAGYLVYAHDHRGHGRSMTTDAGVELDPRAQADSASLHDMIVDTGAFGRYISQSHPGLPLFVVGHAVGAFMIQHAVLDHAGLYSGMVLSGATAIDVLAAAQPDAATRDELVAAARAATTGNEWLTHDSAEAQCHQDDPNTMDHMSARTFAELMRTVGRLSDPDELVKLRSDLPALLVSGRDDPYSGDGQIVALLAQRYRIAGLIDVDVRIYPDTGHQLFLERNRAEIIADIVTWLGTCHHDKN